MSEGNYGVALLNDGKYGFGADGATLTMTIAKCGGFPYEGASDEIPDFTYALLPHGGRDLRGVIRDAYVLNAPFATRPGGTGDLPAAFSLVSCDDEGVAVETVKCAEDGEGIVLRLYEAVKERHTVRLHIGRPIREARLLDLTEREIGELPVAADAVTLTVRPFEILTVKVR